MRIIGIDPGTNRCGWATIDQHGSILIIHLYDTIILKKAPVLDRLCSLYTKLCEVFASYRPDVMAYEAGFVGKYPKTAETLGRARGVIIAVASVANVPVFEYEPTLVKKAVCHGRAGKFQVEAMVKAMFGITENIGSDAADALAVAICHAHRTL